MGTDVHPGDLWSAAQGSVRELADSEHKHRNACYALIAALVDGDPRMISNALASAKRMLGPYAKHAPFEEQG